LYEKGKAASESFSFAYIAELEAGGVPVVAMFIEAPFGGTVLFFVNGEPNLNACL